MARVLVVEDSGTQARHAESLLRRDGHDVTVARNGAEGLAAVRADPPDVVLTDMHMPELDGLELVRVLRAEYPALPVVLTTDRGSEELAVQALRAGASGYIPKRNLAQDLGPVLDELLTVAGMQRKQALFLDRMTSIEHRFALDTDPDLIPQVVGHVEAITRQMSLFDESVRMRIGVAVHEAVTNAMVHGNLEVGSDLKAGNWDAYHAAIAARQKADPYRGRRVHITVRAARTPYLEVRVRDEGPGFDPAKLPDPTDPANIEQGCGRGLLLIRSFFDEVTHNPTGNEITMVRRKA